MSTFKSRSTRALLVVVVCLSMLMSACGGKCSTCGSPTSGGQFMNPTNVSQQVWHWLDQFATK